MCFFNTKKQCFFGSGRYKEQLKLLLQSPQRYYPDSPQRCYSDSPKDITPEGFVATFKSLVIFVSRKDFVPLCLCVKIKKTLSLHASVFKI